MNEASHTAGDGNKMLSTFFSGAFKNHTMDGTRGEARLNVP